MKQVESGYTIFSARFANADGTAVEIQTAGFGAVMISAERQDLWEHAQAWIAAGNAASGFVPARPVAQ